MKQLIFLLGFIALGVFASCERDSTSLELPNTVKVDGLWEVIAYNDSMAISTPFSIQTLTRENSMGRDSLVIKDSQNEFWNFQVSSAVNKKLGAFETELSSCEVCEEQIGIIVSNGKIINNDSIHFEIKFEDDETPFANNYIIKGRRVKG
ncbi:MAG: hypothetical protein ITF98_10460 [Fermentimonas sp.]|nr:hypothetical protein [Fermentimonas sp.]